jgi:hypothetical protein
MLVHCFWFVRIQIQSLNYFLFESFSKPKCLNLLPYLSYLLAAAAQRSPTQRSRPPLAPAAQLRAAQLAALPARARRVVAHLAHSAVNSPPPRAVADPRAPPVIPSASPSPTRTPPPPPSPSCTRPCAWPARQGGPPGLFITARRPLDALTRATRAAASCFRAPPKALTLAHRHRRCFPPPPPPRRQEATQVTRLEVRRMSAPFVLEPES